MESAGNRSGWTKPVFSCVFSFVMTVPASASDPVPAVVVMATIGRGLLETDFPFPVPEGM